MRPVRWNTAGAWLLAFSFLVPLVVGASYVAVNFAALSQESAQERQTNFEFASIWIQVALWVLMVLFALMDRRQLISFGHLRPARAWWILLFPRWCTSSCVASGSLARFVTDSVRSSPILSRSWALFCSASSLQRGINENGGNYVVTRPPTIPDTVGSEFSCTRVPSTSGETHTLNIEVVRGTDGQPTAKLLSVTPPING